MKYIARITYQDGVLPIKIMTANSLNRIKRIALNLVGDGPSDYGVIVDRYQDGHSDIVAIRKTGTANWEYHSG